jgi:Spy/CpxP family protein refolding chaperone
MNQKLFEELIEDTKSLTQSMVQYGDRWSKIAEENTDITDEQKKQLSAVMQDFINTVNDL